MNSLAAAALPALLLGSAPAPRAQDPPPREVRLWDPGGPACILLPPGLDPCRAQLPAPYRTRRIDELYGAGVTEHDLARGRFDGDARAPKKLLGLGGASFLVVYTDAPSTGFLDPAAGPARRAAFELAAQSIVDMIQDTDLVISIDASMPALGTVDKPLASGAASAYYMDSDFPFPNAWYGEPLASHLDDADPDTSNLDIGIQFNASWDASPTPWYYGLDGGTGASEINFVAVARHELTHGLDFTSSFQAGGGTANPDPAAFDMFLQKASGAGLLGLPDLPSTVTGDDVVWGGPVATLVWQNTLFGAGKPPIFAPTPYDDGSSLGHWDESVFTGAWDLMSPVATLGGGLLSVDDVTRGLLSDLGWLVEFEGVYVDDDAGLIQLGKPHQPFGSLSFGVAQAASSGKRDVYVAPGTYDVTSLVIDAPMTLHGWPGTAVVQ